MTELQGIPPSYPPRIVAGLVPTPKVHLGHYFGAIRDLVRLQHEYPGDTFYLIADHHSLSRGVVGETLIHDTLELVTGLLALGLDPNKTILYRQSDIPACVELVWYVSCILPSSEVGQATPYRRMLESAEAPSAGSLLYPLLMAADVLSVRGTRIQVGADQQLNAEIVQTIARHLNHFFGWEVFPIPQVQFSGTEVVPGTDGRKMSHAHSNTIDVFEPFYRLQEQVRSIAVPAPGEPVDPETCTLHRLFSLVAPTDEAEAMADGWSRGTLGADEARRRLTQALQEYFADAEARYHELKKNPDFVRDVLREGVRQAQLEARSTLDLVRDLFGLAA